jgi:phosphonate transport system permease protein
MALVWAVRSVEIIPEFLIDAPEQMLDLLARMWPPDLGHYHPAVHLALVETLHIASLGTLFSFIFAIPFALLAARNICPYRGLNSLAQLLLVTSRSVNSLVWALIFVAIFGPGAAAGTVRPHVVRSWADRRRACGGDQSRSSGGGQPACEHRGVRPCRGTDQCL